MAKNAIREAQLICLIASFGTFLMGLAAIFSPHPEAQIPAGMIAGFLWLMTFLFILCAVFAHTNRPTPPEPGDFSCIRYDRK